MSEFFSKQNKAEFGPGPVNKINWIIIEPASDVNGETRCAIVNAKTAYFALNDAQTLFHDLDRQKCICYPGPNVKIKVYSDE